MQCHLFGIWRSSSILCVVLILNVDVNFARSISAEDYDTTDDDEILCIAAIHRHGDRNPIHSYPTDPYEDYEWPRGLGALTERGAQQEYQLGKNFEKIYRRLKKADGVYDQANAHHVASSPERTRMSGASMLAGFYKPYPNGNFMEIDWQPVPMTVYPAMEDYTLYQALVQCPKYDKELDELVNNPGPRTDIYKFNEENVDVYNYISNHTGEKVSNCYAPAAMHDVLFIQETNGFVLPEWTKAIYPNKTLECRARCFQLLTETEDMKRLRGGPIILEAYTAMSSYQNGSSTQKIITYSAHDTTIANALYSMDMGGQTDPIPNYGSCLVFEYRRDRATLEEYVQMVYFSDYTTTTPQRLEITGCPHPCTLRDFNATFSHLFVYDYKQECRGAIPENSFTRFSAPNL